MHCHSEHTSTESSAQLRAVVMILIITSLLLDGIFAHKFSCSSRVIGCGFSITVATEPVAAIVHFWNIPLV